MKKNLFLLSILIFFIAFFMACEKVLLEETNNDNKEPVVTNLEDPEPTTPAIMEHKEGMEIIHDEVVLKPTDRCVFDNPLTDLPWLKQRIDAWENLTANGYPSHVRIYQCTYVDGIGFIEESFIETSAWTYYLISCAGEHLCNLWGSYGGPCTEFNVDFENKQLIWEINL